MDVRISTNPIFFNQIHTMNECAKMQDIFMVKLLKLYENEMENPFG